MHSTCTKYAEEPWIVASFAGLVALIAAAFGALAFHTLYDARLWYDACRVEGATPEFYQKIEEEALQALAPAGQPSAVKLKPALTDWFGRNAGRMATETEKLALMDATFRAVRMQYAGAYRSIDYVGPQEAGRETITYNFAYRDRDNLKMRVLGYVTFGVRWSVDEDGGLGDFLSISNRYSTAVLDRAFQRARSDAQPLCPQPARQVQPPVAW